MDSGWSRAITTKSELEKHLTELVRGDCPRDVWFEALEAVRSGPVSVGRGLTSSQEIRFTYDRLRLLGGKVPVASDLIGDPHRLFALDEWMAVASPSLFAAAHVHYGMCAALVSDLGAGHPDFEGYRRTLDTMEAFGSLLLTESGFGNSHIRIRTTATYDARLREFVLHTPDRAARKIMSNVGMPGVAKLGVVYAALVVSGVERGVFPFLIQLRTENGVTPQVSIDLLPSESVMPLDYSVVAFDEVRLPFDSWLRDTATIAEDGSFHDPIGGPDQRAARSLEVSPNALAAGIAALASVTRASIAIAVRYAHNRHVFSRFAPDLPVIRYRTHQRALFGGLATAYAVTCLANRAKDARARVMIDRSSATSVPPADETRWPSWVQASHAMSLAKALASSAAEQVCAESSARCGAQGVFRDNRMVEYSGLAHVLNVSTGDSRLAYLEVARNMVWGSDYEPPAEEEPPTSEIAVTDPLLCRVLPRIRERSLHQELRARLAQAREDGLTPFDAWNEQSILGTELARTHATRLAVDTFQDAVHGLGDPATQKVLDPLCTFYGIEQILADAAWYLSEGLLTAEQYRAMPALLNKLCDDITPHALTLVDAFEIPDDLLAAPIAGHNGAALEKEHG